MGEEGSQECLVLALVGEGRLDGLVEVVEIVRDEVGQVGVFGMVPALLDGVQFRRIGGQWLEGEPRRMVLLAPRRRRSMHAPPIPDEDHVATIVTVQEPQQPDQLLRVDVPRREMEVE